jgi:hypothetical protein
MEQTSVKYARHIFEVMSSSDSDIDQYFIFSAYNGNWNYHTGNFIEYSKVAYPGYDNLRGVIKMFSRV